MSTPSFIESEDQRAWKELGQLIVRERNRRQLSQRDAAKSANIAHQTWSRYEMGEAVRMRRMTATKIEKLFGWEYGHIESFIARTNQVDPIWALNRILELENQVTILTNKLNARD